jgi:hypothetical protein
MDGPFERYVPNDQSFPEADEKTFRWHWPQYGWLSDRQPIIDASEAIHHSGSDRSSPSTTKLI